MGNKQYEHFNAVGKAVHNHLVAIGGRALLPVGLGDDDADIADDFEARVGWKCWEWGRDGQ